MNGNDNDSIAAYRKGCSFSGEPNAQAKEGAALE